MHLSQGQYAQVVVEQGDTDLALDLVSPSAVLIRSLDEFEFGPEWASLTAEQAGDYRVCLKAVGPPTAGSHYTLRLAVVRAGASGDADEAQAEELATSAKIAMSSSAADARLRALALNRQALALWQALNNQRAAAGTRLKIGETLYAMNDASSARDEFLLARQGCKQLPDSRCVAEAANNAGLSAWRLTQTEEASSMLTEALTLWTEIGTRYGQAATENNLGLLSWQTGEWQQAIDHHLKAIELFRPQHPSEAAVAENNLGLDYLSLGYFREAVSYLEEARVSFHERSQVTTEGRTVMNLGRAWMFLGQLDVALSLQYQAMALLKDSPEVSYRADVLNNMGQVFFRKNSFSEAQTKFEQAIDLYGPEPDLRGKAAALHYLGQTFAAQGNTEAGLNSLKQALAIRLDRNLYDDAAESLYQIGVLYGKVGNKQEAASYLKQAIDLSESLRTKALGLHFRSSYFATKQPYYEAYIDVLMALHQQSPGAGYDRQAFAVSEQARARCLMDSLAETRADIRAGVDIDLLESERQLRRRLSLTSYSLASASLHERNDASERTLRRQLDKMLEEYEQLEALLREKSPAYSALIEPKPLGPEAIQSQFLDADTLLLEYFLGDRASFGFAVSRESLSAFVLPPRDVLETPVRDMLRLLSKDRLDAASPTVRKKLRVDLATLARYLLGSVQGAYRFKRLAIVADGLLQYVPFAALPSSSLTKTKAATDTPLGLEYQIVTLPSASSIARAREVRARAPQAPKTIAIFADPVFDSQDSRVRAVVPRSASSSSDTNPLGPRLPRLVFSRDDVNTVRQLVSPQDRLIATDFAASRKTLMSPKTGQYRILHFSTHASVDDKQPSLTSIALSMVDRQGRAVDGFIRPVDIYNLRNLHAQVVVLSACRTAVGQQVRGEGVIGLSRPFFYAGASQVIMTLWNIDDEASAKFMQYFYQAMLGPRKESVDQAVRSAERIMFNSKTWISDPFYWAGFVLQGDWE